MPVMHDAAGFQAYLAVEFGGSEEKCRDWTGNWTSYTWDNPEEGWLIYGMGGYHRYYVLESGEVVYSGDHGRSEIAAAKAAGFRLRSETNEPVREVLG